ncbi:MAG: TetR/AcrR family transcriptional regulator [Myxococcota bacterium]|nr:TetR/AcrR family transcriptional regulator [Myxococcota bacterium]
MTTQAPGIAGSAATDLRTKIVDQALEIIREKGVDGITMRILARRLGYSPATLYLHFHSKAELLQVVADIGFGQLQEQLDEALVPGDPEQTLEKTARVYVAFGLRNPELYRTMFEWRPSPDSVSPGSEDDARDRLFVHCREAIASGIEQGGFRQQDPSAAVMLYAAALHGAVHMAQAQHPGTDAATLGDWLVSDRLAAVRAGAGPAARCA